MKSVLDPWISKLSQGRILVVGDLVIDEMIYGATHRLSREAPVMILKHQRTDIILGAAGNAAHNVARLNAERVAVVGVAGKDYYCSLLLDALQRDRIDAAGLIQDADRPTSTKTRISGMANHSVTQQVVRIDRESSAPVSPAVEARLLDTLSRLAPEFDALLLSDYALGVFTPAVIDHCRSLCERHNLIMAVDSQQDLRAFRGATVITPNQTEAERQVGFELNTSEAVHCAGLTLLRETGSRNILITRGESGMSLFEGVSPENDGQQGGAPRETNIPVFNHSEVFDVTGAGDTVIATLTLAMAAGAPLAEAAMLGNLAASIVVKRFGAATTTSEELRTALADLDPSLLEPDLLNAPFGKEVSLSVDKPMQV